MDTASSGLKINYTYWSPSKRDCFKNRNCHPERNRNVLWYTQKRL